jgi:putative peptidoglycan lipid II flippase
MGAALIAAGILLSRILGLVREALKAAYLGASGSVAADAFNAAFRIPNLLQVLFGEGALSASFIPVYANLLARGDKDEARRVAGAVLGLLALITSIIVLLGVLLTPAIILLIAPGFSGERRELTIVLTRILFPGTGLFVMAAWCLGILNSHRRFFLSYAAPVAWNIAMIVTLLLARHEPSLNRIAIDLAWGSVIGAGLQFLVQLPTVLRLVPQLRVSLDRTSEHVRSVIRNFVPVFVSRGVVQISAYVDQFIASFLPIGAVSLLFYAQTISMLPVSLFGISIAAAELPEMSSILGEQSDVASRVRERLNTGLRRVAFFVIPSAAGFLLLGDVLSAALYQRGRFHASDSLYVWTILAGSAVGLLAGTLGRLYSSAYYALRDTRTPLRFALIRVGITIALGYFFALPLPRLLGINAVWGIAGLTASAGIAGWVEFLLLRSRMNARIGETGVPASHVIKLWGAAALAGAAGVAVQYQAGVRNPMLNGMLVVAVFSVIYFGVTHLAGVPDAAAFIRRVRGARRPE